MSGPFGSQHWMYNSSSDFYSYTIDQSLRFDDGDSPALSKAYSTAQTNTKIITVSVWVKRANLGIRTAIMFAKSGSSGWFEFGTDDKLRWNPYNTGYNGFISTRVFRDTSSWYHIVATADSDTQSGANIYNVYVNGEQLTNSDGSTHVPDDTATKILANGITTYIGDDTDGAYHFDGYLAEMHVIDGSVVAHTQFGETSNGIWVPKEYSGSYGNNGFYLSFADSANIGDDLSGNTNDFTVSNLVATDVVPDSPTNNFATLNPIYHSASQATLLEGNLKADTAGLVNAANGYGAVSTFAIPKDKKIYIEVECTDGVGSNWFAGFASQSGLESGPSSTNVGGSNAITVYNRSVYVNGSETDYGSSAGLGGTGAANLAAGDILGCMCDGATSKVWFSRNGTYFKTPTTNDSGTTGDPAGGNHEIGTITNGTTEDVFFVLGGNTSVSSIFVNFGQDSTNVASANADANGLGTFEYAPPTDYVCLASSSLTDSTIGPNSGLDEQSGDYFNTVLYTGTGSSQSITGVGFQPDWVWIKGRSNSRRHMLFDSVRGVQKRLISDDTNSELTMTDGLSSFDSDGFTEGGNLNTGNSSETLVAWNWKAGGAANTFNVDGTGYADMSSAGLTDGTIALSGLSANTTSGFSVATFTMTSGNNTLAHGLGAEPDLLIFKRRDAVASWVVWARPFGENTKSNLLLDGTAAAGSSGSGNWIQNITNTLVGIGDYGNMAAAGTHVMYAFASVDGHSKVGSYIGNGNADGTFVYTEFRPAWVMVRRSSSTGGWHIFDNKRPNAYNVINKRLEADNTDAENSTSGCEIDFVSNGFKFRGNFDNINGNGATHIYLAFAEAPFKYANAR